MTTPQINQQVKCFLKNSICVEGIVQIWNDEQIVLRTLVGEKLLIIYHPKEEVMMVELDPIIKPKEIVQEKQLTRKDKLEQKFEETKQLPPSPLKNKTLAQLRMMLIEEEKKIIEEKVKSHTITNEVRSVQYGSQFSTFPRVK